VKANKDHSTAVLNLRRMFYQHVSTQIRAGEYLSVVVPSFQLESATLISHDVYHEKSIPWEA